MSHSTLPLFSLQPEIKEIPLTQGKVALVDAADYEWLSQFNWCANQYDRSWYAVRGVRLPNGKQGALLMHRVILGVTSPKILVDHIDWDGLNNVRTNLRQATRQQNQWNRRISRASTSGFKGVSADSGRWKATIYLEGRPKYLGMFDDAVAAAHAYDAAAREFFGTFAACNFPNET